MDYIAKAVGLSGQLGVALPKETGRMAMVVVATLPNRDFVSILPTLLCKRSDYRWRERIVLVEKKYFSVPNFPCVKLILFENLFKPRQRRLAV